MGYSKITDNNLLTKIVDFGNTREYEILHNDNMESDSQSSNENNCSSSDSCSDMDVDNTEEHKEHTISKQEQIDTKTFCYYSHNDQNIIIMFLKYTKQGNFHDLKENQDCLWSLQDIRRICWRQLKRLKHVQRKIEDEHSKYILSEVDKTDHYQHLWILIKSEFNIDVGRIK